MTHAVVDKNYCKVAFAASKPARKVVWAYPD